MKTRLARLSVVSGLAVAAFAPTMTSTANAFMCTDLTRAVCVVYSTACQYVPEDDKYPVRKLACESFD